MTSIYFVRHAQPDHEWAEDRTRPLTQEGMADSEIVAKTLAQVTLDYAICSPYKRSLDTIRLCAADHGLSIEPMKDFGNAERVAAETAPTCSGSGGQISAGMRRMGSLWKWSNAVT